MTSSSAKSSLPNIFSPITPYLSEDAAAKLKQYKYTGGDNGVVYRYFYNPLAIKLVTYLPENIA